MSVGGTWEWGFATEFTFSMFSFFFLFIYFLIFPVPFYFDYKYVILKFAFRTRPLLGYICSYLGLNQCFWICIFWPIMMRYVGDKFIKVLKHFMIELHG